MKVKDPDYLASQDQGDHCATANRSLCSNDTLKTQYNGFCESLQTDTKTDKHRHVISQGTNDKWNPVFASFATFYLLKSILLQQYRTA